MHVEQWDRTTIYFLGRIFRQYHPEVLAYHFLENIKRVQKSTELPLPPFVVLVDKKENDWICWMCRHSIVDIASKITKILGVEIFFASNRGSYNSHLLSTYVI